MRKVFFLAITILTVCVSSCLKDKNIDDQVYGIDGIEGTQLVEISETPQKTVVLDYMDKDTSFALFTVHLNSATPATEDITVTVIPNVILISDYNTQNGTALEVAPTSIYTLDNLTVTIPKGSREGVLTISTNPADLSLGEYALGFTISAVSSAKYVVSSNYKDVLVTFSIKNKYDGVYKLKIKTTGWAAYGISDGVTGTYPEETELMTVDASSVSSFSTFRGDGLLTAFSGGVGTLGPPTGFGATTPLFIFDNATNKLIDVQNTTPPDTRGRTLSLNPTVTDSRYDPDTKTIYAAFIMMQIGRPHQLFYDTLTYVRAR